MKALFRGDIYGLIADRILLEYFENPEELYAYLLFYLMIYLSAWRNTFIKKYIFLILSLTVFYCRGQLAFDIWMIPTRSLFYCKLHLFSFIP